MHRHSLVKLKKVFVAISGGVDSSVASALLKKQGHEVVGIHIKMWSDPDIPCAFKEDRYDAMRVAAHLGIPFQTWDFTKEYRKSVVEYMISEYAKGRTPNPDVMCNKEIKFGIFLKRALEKGADYVATGHYTRVIPSAFCFRDTQVRSSGGLVKGRRNLSAYAETEQISPPIVARNKMPRSRNVNENGVEKFKLLAGVDVSKDQSYFLWTLTQAQLKHCLFPIGEYTKPEVRALARKFGLPTADKPDSQGICFIGEIDVRQFLKKYIQPRRGLVLTTSGKVIGEHEGVPFYTMGQREGLGIGGGIPYYVAEKNLKANILTVAECPYDEKLFSRKLRGSNVNWISGKAPEFPFCCLARIRYRQPLQPCRVTRIYADRNGDLRGLHNLRASALESASIRVVFEEPQRAVTPGQSIVFYQKGEMLGGGVIVF